MKNLYPYLRPLKALRQVQLENSYADRTGQLNIGEVRNRLITPIGQMPGISENNSAPGNYLIDDVDFVARIDASANDSPQLTGVTLYGGFLRSQWGHFLMNSTARLWPLYQNNAPKVDQILFFSDSPGAKTLSGNYKEFFVKLGIEHKVVITDTSVNVESMLVPDIAFEHLRFFSMEFMLPFKFLCSKCTPRPDSPRKVFLTRSQLPGAASHEINLKHIDSAFQHNGFEVIAPEKLPLAQLITILQGAEVVASVSGSLAHNFLFAGKHTELMIIERTPVCNYFQAGINRILCKHPVMIDAFRQPRPAPSTGSLFLYAPTEEWKLFTKDYTWATDDFRDSDKTLLHELRTFLRTYRREYAYESGLQSWETEDAAAITEACAESADVYRRWLNGSCPVFITDLLHPRTLRRSIMRLLKRFRH